jgi:phosphatidylserine/phosphatidylglycerophosphate/cardiolipin synthase-like enzyme
MTHGELITAISEARERLPRATWENLVQTMQAEVGVVSRAGIARVLDRVGNAEVRHRVDEALTDNLGMSWSVALVAAETAAHWASQAEASVEMVWTGPSSSSFAARRIDQILYDLLAGAREQVFLITFSAYRVARLSAALSGAQARGVKITLLLETSADSDGQLSNDALNAFSDLRLDQIEILQWPKENRGVNAAGKPGKLHAKCAVVDDAVVISSANLTDDAFNRNMEMGVVAYDAELAGAVRKHFEELKNAGILRVITPQ